MSDRPNRIRALTDSLGLEIDRLIRQLPGADPTLRGEPTGRPSPARASAPRAVATGPAPSRGQELLGAWSRTLGAATLGAAVLYWPYAHECGWLLHAYLGVIGAVLVTGCWASWSAWRLRVAVAHVAGLLVVFWGIVLAAEQVLPRIGYAAWQASWRCAA